MALLDDAKQVCRVAPNVTAYDAEFNDLILSALADMGITDINPEVLVSVDPDPLVKRAILTYCKLNFGELDDGVYDRLKAAYDEQKAQMLMSGSYTNWG